MDIHQAPNRYDPAALLRLKQVLELVPVCPSTWWAGVKSARFPAPVKLGPRTTCWRARDIFELIERLNDNRRR
jgi:predicted DNA-binding transcriptional regulator AlpA